jgi:hypothetical protein
LTFAAPIAAAEEPALGAKSLAMGWTGVAGLRDNVALRLNPGVLPLTERYDFEGSFRFGPEGGLHWSGSAVDARTSDVIIAGVGYYGNLFEPPPTIDELPAWVADGEEITNQKWIHDIVLSLSTPLFDRKVGFGLTFAPAYHDEDLNGTGWTFDMHAGVGVKPTEWLTVGIASRNLLPWGVRYGDTEIGGGFLVEAEKIDLQSDVRFRPTIDKVPLIGAGFQYSVDETKLRTGWRLDEEQTSWVSAGIGFGEEGGSIGYGLSVPIGESPLQRSMHEVSVRFGAQQPIPDVY